jgi:hypothetical protein
MRARPRRQPLRRAPSSPSCSLRPLSSSASASRTLGPKLHTFHLQDVSQRPLTVDGARLPRIAVGDQVEIEGVLQGSGKDLVLVGLAMKRVKVTGGGGCC